ncbi:helix-turn-helix domain-containing protein [Actinokineospora enzanensis]|uniref:helix-turn-helix domain-containing protein n=1 Tax=Actinokineospora enzanensis TaxID=155975 RepID=UPI00035F1ED4|nr:helix-turn-helix transcriptional regulator [Actinokineospora enzanensis]
MANESVGARIRQLRGRHITQRELADAAEVSIDLIRKLEQGQRHTASVPYLHRIARALGTDLGGLLGQPQSVAEDDVDTVGAIREALTSIDDLLDEVDDVDAPSLPDIQRGAEYAWGAFSGGRYDLLGQVLPRLLAETRAAAHGSPAEEAGIAADLAAQMRQIAIGTLMQHGALDLAHIAAREAITDAERGHDPLRAIAVRHAFSHVLVRQGRQDKARQLVLGAVRAVDRLDGVSAEAVRGALLLRAAGAASRAGDGNLALNLVGEADDIAQRIGDARTDHGSHYGLSFGQSQVVVIGTDIAVVAGDFDTAFTRSREMPARGEHLPLMSRTRHLADVALTHAQLGDDARATSALLAMEAMAPHLLPFHRLAKSVARELLGRRPTKPLREFAKRAKIAA